MDWTSFTKHAKHKNNNCHVSRPSPGLPHCDFKRLEFIIVIWILRTSNYDFKTLIQRKRNRKGGGQRQNEGKEKEKKYWGSESGAVFQIENFTGVTLFYFVAMKDEKCTFTNRKSLKLKQLLQFKKQKKDSPRRTEGLKWT